MQDNILSILKTIKVVAEIGEEPMTNVTKYMRAQIQEDDWIKIETSHGVRWLEKNVVGVPLEMRLPGCMPKEWNGKFADCDYNLQAILANYYSIYYTGSASSFEVVHGFGARLSAPGYLDSTDWYVFDTVEEALKHIEELRNKNN